MFDSVLLPFKSEWEHKKILISKLCFELNQIKNIKQGSDKSCQQQLQ